MKLYNTLTRQKEEFIPYEGNKVGFYTCGPTVYHYAHIGNMRNYIGHDILDKTLRYLGYDVKRVMNITDVGHLKSDSDSGEDKMVASAKKEHKSVMDIAKFYTDAFFKDFDMLNCRRPDVVSPATDNIDEYINSFNKWNVHIDTEDMRTMCTSEITYVHELQHLLKLCKIEKEIVL